MNAFTLDGRSTSEWGIGLSAGGAYDAPARKGESISVPGRSGNIWVDGGAFENVFVTYPCWMSEGFDTNLDDFRAFLSGHSDDYYVLSDTYHPGEHRLARYSGPFTAEPGTGTKSGRMDVTFECQPQRFLASGNAWREIEIPSTVVTVSGVIIFQEENPTVFDAMPVICFRSSVATTVEFSFSSYLYKYTPRFSRYVKNNVYISGVEADKYYYLDTQTLMCYVGTSPSVDNWKDLSLADVTVEIHEMAAPLSTYLNYELKLYSGMNTITNMNRAASPTNLTYFAILTRYWTV